jgi:hypothetical protein
VVQWGIPIVPREPIFENVLIFEKKGANSKSYHANQFLKNVLIFDKKGADAFENDPPFIILANPQ